MNTLFKSSRFFPILLICAASSACGKSGPPLGEMAPVSGKVTVDGQPVTSGQVSLIPTDASISTGGSVCAGTIDSSGNYVINTAGKTGAPLGKYKVTVTVSMVPTGDSKMPSALFNAKFSDQSKTPLAFTVEANPQAGAYDLKMTK